MRRKSTLEEIYLFSWKMVYPFEERKNKEKQKTKYYIKYGFLDGLLDNDFDHKIHVSLTQHGNALEFKLDPNKQKQNYLIVEFPKDENADFVLLSYKITYVPTLDEMRNGKKCESINNNYGNFNLKDAIYKASSILNEWIEENYK